MGKKQFVVIGLGRFGTSVAKTLYTLGNDVLAIDSSDDIVQSISDSVTHSVQMNATDENSLRALGIRNFDVAVITIGSDIQASTMATLLVKEMGVKYIIAKANTEIHAKVLYKIGADRVVFPERDMGVRVAHNLVSTNILDYIELSPNYSIAEIVIPKIWHGKTLNELNIRANYGINVVALKRGEEINVSPVAEDTIESGDIIVAIGSEEDLTKVEILNVD
ncbi:MULTISPECIES: potassium channel family protein [Clostridium]|jgi:trk system potassium uptake protein TrkA|uniref:Transporter n=6 Tax=Clostridium TaxID=1485 RepID=A5I6L3_CLOBH|nr:MULTISPECIES: TrkA family potassium uptake protein [Clostridium]EKN42145.1 TrkA family potassium uptake protein [Clostridium botulinum CFSAN001627]EPS49381.1 TrkA family potassium uptake protein [Clostridium botulinum CFSAN002369]MBE6078923.1 TrkA family potassium uptake protein [Clostridium lundense]ABS35160.1 potassium uptake protein, TrkA family [Clostridium botulinum A str. ATCC 19397]ABS36502.1 potassium uptake protein, TrkA family [Clostridium botulinum A str. Hall]